ncbi:MAG: hypothetical protein ACOVOR_04585 [Rhabdochlamydiaceae bacterium]
MLTKIHSLEDHINQLMEKEIYLAREILALKEKKTQSYRLKDDFFASILADIDSLKKERILLLALASEELNLNWQVMMYQEQLRELYQKINCDHKADTFIKTEWQQLLIPVYRKKASYCVLER